MPPIIMKLQSFLLTLLLTTSALRAQEPQPLGAEELAKATALLIEASSRLGALPLKFDPASELAAGFKAGEVGLLLIPDKRLKAAHADPADLKLAKGETLPVGQLWTMNLSPKDKDATLPNAKLRLTKITAGDKELELAVFALGIEQSAKGELQLALYGKGEQPVLRVPLTLEKNSGAAPVVLSARKTGDESGVLELKFLGRYRAEIPMGKQAE